MPQKYEIFHEKPEREDGWSVRPDPIDFYFAYCHLLTMDEAVVHAKCLNSRRRQCAAIVGALIARLSVFAQVVGRRTRARVGWAYGRAFSTAYWYWRAYVTVERRRLLRGK